LVSVWSRLRGRTGGSWVRSHLVRMQSWVSLVAWSGVGRGPWDLVSSSRLIVSSSRLENYSHGHVGSLIRFPYATPRHATPRSNRWVPEWFETEPSFITLMSMSISISISPPLSLSLSLSLSLFSQDTRDVYPVSDRIEHARRKDRDLESCQRRTGRPRRESCSRCTVSQVPVRIPIRVRVQVDYLSSSSRPPHPTPTSRRHEGYPC
jgi:hypothetical protein